MTGCKVCSRDGSINICPPSQTNHRFWHIRHNEELIRTAFFTWQSLSMPTGHRKWKCLVTEIRPAEEVALTALPGHSDAQRYYKVTRYGKNACSCAECDSCDTAPLCQTFIIANRINLLFHNYSARRPSHFSRNVRDNCLKRVTVSNVLEKPLAYVGLLFIYAFIVGRKL